MNQRMRSQRKFCIKLRIRQKQGIFTGRKRQTAEAVASIKRGKRGLEKSLQEEIV
jgi:hypothetical protein